MVVGWFFRVYGYARLSRLPFRVRQRHPTALSPVTVKKDAGREDVLLNSTHLPSGDLRA